jgi:phage terminase large subunit
MNIELPHEWSPRHYQMRAWDYLENGGKRAALIWHRRAGKDDVALRWTSVASQMRIGNYWHMLPEASQARKAMWDAVNPHSGQRRIDEAFPIEMRELTRNNEMFIRFKNGSTWQLMGSDNFDSLVGATPVGLVFSEYAVGDPRAWPLLSPILMENGGWAIFPYTPRGKNHGWTLRASAQEEADWLLDEQSVDKTRILDPKLLEAERRRLIREEGPDDGESIFQQEYHVSFEAAVRGAYYAKLMMEADKDGRITGVPYDAKGLVTTSWDIGYRDSTAIWFLQGIGRELRVIDYYEASGVDIAHYASVIKAKPYAYETHILPHDASSSGKLATGKSIEELLRAMGLNVRIAPMLKLETGIQAVRTLMPKMWFDARKCERGIAALRLYRTEYDEERKILSANPLHDWTSHAADSLRYFAVTHREKQRPEANVIPIRRRVGWVV